MTHMDTFPQEVVRQIATINRRALYRPLTRKDHRQIALLWREFSRRIG